MDNPKILVISHNCFSKVSNNGKTLESIFKYFPKAKLAQVFFSQNESPDFEFCDTYFKITDSNVLESLIKGYADCGIELSPKEEVAQFQNQQFKSKSNLFRLAKSMSDYMVLFRDFLWSFNSWKSKSFLDWTTKVCPDIVFYVGGNYGFSHAVAQFTAKKMQAPLVCYFTDDYLIFPKNKNILDWIQRRRMKQFYTLTVDLSSLCFAIGDSMAKEYTNYFGKVFYPIMNSIEKQEYVPYIGNQDLKLTYIGGLHLDRWRMLIRLANFLTNGAIHVYSIERPSDEILLKFKNHNILYKGAVRGQDLIKTILESDVLLHVESDDVYNSTLTKLSVSTKIPEYLMSGRLVVGFGPEDVASMKILSDNSIGIVLSSRSQDSVLKNKLETICTNFEMRKQIGLKGYKFAVENFDNEKTAKGFQNKIIKLN
jgi:glycosyltransferase involved in cell wall biosynthesis